MLVLKLLSQHSENKILSNLSEFSILFLAVTKQERFSPFVCLSVCLFVHLSVCLSVTPFSQCFCHRIIMKFSVITNDKSDVHGKGQRSKVKVPEVKTQLSSFRTVTPV